MKILIVRTHYLPFLCVILLGLSISQGVLASEGNINNTEKYAWSEIAGWFNFRPTNGGVMVFDDHLSGFAWAENIGWIKLGTGSGGGDPYYDNTDTTDWGVNRDSAGLLAGYAWSETVGWINFNPSHSQVTIDSNGYFNGYAWAENIGWIHFQGAAPVYSVLMNLGNNPADPPTVVAIADEDLIGLGPVALQTSVYSDFEGDSHLKTHWLVRRADRVYGSPGYDASFDSVSTTGDLTKHTVSGLNQGMKYVWRVGYVDFGSGITSWSREYAFKVGTSVMDNPIQIYPGSTVEDFEMVSFVHWPDAPAAPSVLGIQYSTSNFRIGAYDPTIGNGAYLEYGSSLKIEPGRAYWFLARDGLDITISGVPVSMSDDIEVGLDYNETVGNGWNMIGSPNNADYYWADVEVLEYDTDGNIVYGPTAISALSDPNPYIDTRLWRWDAGSYYSDATWMQKHEGYWVKVKRANVFLRFPVSAQARLSNPGIMFAALLSKGEQFVKKYGLLTPGDAVAANGDSPPGPMGDFSTRSDSNSGSYGGDGSSSRPTFPSSGEVSGGGAGCFIGTLSGG